MRDVKGQRLWGVGFGAAVWMLAMTIAHAAPADMSATSVAPFADLVKTCAPGVHPALMGRIGTVESSGNPFAIGVVGGRLARQPTNRAEALATVAALNAGGWNYSLGLVQVNRYNLARFSKTAADMLNPCANLSTGAAILRECYDRAQPGRIGVDAAVRAALSCYYSGHLTRGAGYARKVSMAEPLGQTRVSMQPESAAVPAIPVIPDVASSDRGGRERTGTALPRVRVESRGEARRNQDDEWFTSWGDDQSPSRGMRKREMHDEWDDDSGGRS